MPKSYTDAQIEAAIAAEAIDWALHFEVTEAILIEQRRNVMRANVSIGYLAPLAAYLPSNERLAKAFNDSGVFKPFICVGKD